MKRLHIILMNAGILFLCILAFAGCEDNGANKKPDLVPVTHKVQITNMMFTPAEIYVNKGDKVLFVNHDLVAHNVTEEASKAWTSGDLQTEQSWEAEILQTADYYCTLHPVMKGKIIVR